MLESRWTFRTRIAHLRINHKLLSTKSSLIFRAFSPFSVDVFVYSSRTCSSKQACIVGYIRLNVLTPCFGTRREAQMDWLVFGVVRASQGNGGEDVGGERGLRRRVFDRLAFAE